MEELRSRGGSSVNIRRKTLPGGLRAVVTGGAGLIGSEIVRTFRREGVSVDFLDIDEERGNRLAYECGARFHQVDISDMNALDVCLDGIFDSRGDIDIVVNCAAVVDFVPLNENTPERFM